MHRHAFGRNKLVNWMQLSGYCQIPSGVENPYQVKYGKMDVSDSGACRTLFESYVILFWTDLRYLEPGPGAHCRYTLVASFPRGTEGHAN